MKIHSTLVSGAGNTFHIINEKELSKPLSPVERKSIARDICQKNAADGLIFLESMNNKNLRWFFYNNDGSDAEMCGNATRCVGYFAKNILKDTNQEWNLTTTAGLIRISAKSEKSFEVIMTPIQELKSELGFYCNTGVPHLVLEIEDLGNAAKVKETARKLRFDPSFLQGGTNVTYVQKLQDPKNIKAISYERGVEDYTQACGTGAMAAAFYNFKKHAVIETNVEMPGGMLIMNLSNLHQPVMTGPAELLGKFDYEI